MNTTEIIAKLRAQAAELTAMADALEEARHYVGTWVRWTEIPTMSLFLDTEGDIGFRHADGRGEWVGILSKFDAPFWCGVERYQPFEKPDSKEDLFQIVELGLHGDEDEREVRSIVERFKASQVPA